MTNAAIAIGLTYDGTDLQDANPGWLFELVRGLNETPDVRGVDLVVPARAYRSVRNRVADQMPIELQGHVMGVGADEDAQRADFRGLVNDLRTLFDPTREPADLVATLEDGSTATISARPLPGMVWDQVVPSYGRVSIQLQGLSDWTITSAGS
jgi:hypothetical protein